MECMRQGRCSVLDLVSQLSGKLLQNVAQSCSQIHLLYTAQRGTRSSADM